MKNFIKSLALLIFVIVIASCSKDAVENNEAPGTDLTHTTTVENSRKKIKVDLTLTSNEGCEVHIVGEIDVNISVLGSVTVNGFEGSVEFSGSGDCPNGTLTFGKSRASESLTVYLDGRTCRDLSKVTWEGPRDAARILNEERSNDAIVNAIKNLSCQ